MFRKQKPAVLQVSINRSLDLARDQFDSVISVQYFPEITISLNSESKVRNNYSNGILFFRLFEFNKTVFITSNEIQHFNFIFIFLYISNTNAN
jgi:hypothetical protein